MPFSNEQIDVLMRPINGARVESRQQGGKQLSYVAAWDIKAHLIRILGFGNFDIETLEQQQIGEREYKNGDKAMVEVSWMAKVQLTVRDLDGQHLCRFSETAVGSTSGPSNMIGEHHDNAVKTAASDALKRCAINLGSQFGLSLYQNGSRNEVVRNLVVDPRGEQPKPEPSAEQAERLAAAVGAPVESPASEEQTGE